jgi:hypothetical protein
MCPQQARIEFLINRVFGTDGGIIAKTRQQFKKADYRLQIITKNQATSLGRFKPVLLA